MLKINQLAVRLGCESKRPEPFDSPFVLSLSKDERFTQDRHLEGRMANYDTASGGAAAGKVDEKRLEKACQEFESLFIHQMIKTMRQTVPRTGFMGEGRERNKFQTLFDEEISKAISKRGGMGLGKILYQQMQKKGGETLLKEGGLE